MDEYGEELSQLKAFKVQAQNAYPAVCKHLKEEEKNEYIKQKRLKYQLEEKLRQKQQTRPSKPELDEDHSRKLSQESTDSSGSEGQAERDKHVVDNRVRKPEKHEKKLLSAFQQNTCLSALNKTLLEDMVYLLQLRSINNGERLLRRGEKPTALYILIAGACEMTSFDESDRRGTPVPHWIVFGGEDLYFDTPRLMSCKCVQRGAVWFLSREKFTKLMPRHNLPKKIYGNLKAWFPGLTKDDLKFITKNSKATTCIEIPIRFFDSFKKYFVEPDKTLTIKEEDGLTFTTKSSGYESLPESSMNIQMNINISNSSNIAIGDNATVYRNTENEISPALQSNSCA